MVVPSPQQYDTVMKATSSTSTTVPTTSAQTCEARGAIGDTSCRNNGYYDIQEPDGGDGDDGDTTIVSNEPQMVFPLHQMLEDFALDTFGDSNDASLLEDRIRYMIQTNPHLVHDFNTDGLLALHVACMEGVSLAVIESLVQYHVESVATPTRNKKQMLPLHLVCRYYSGPSATLLAIVRYLLSVYPEAARMPTGTNAGEFALHLCCQNPYCTLPLLKLVVQAFPEAVRLPTRKRRQLPLHLACERHYFDRLPTRGKNPATATSTTSEGIIRFFVEMDRASVLSFDSKGSLPIHSAVRGYQTPTTLKYLLSVHPDSIQFVDAKGRTPLHISASNAVPDVATTALLLNADPSATSLPDHYQNIPLNYATQSNHLDLIFLLAQSAPASLDILRNKV